MISTQSPSYTLYRRMQHGIFRITYNGHLHTFVPVHPGIPAIHQENVFKIHFDPSHIDCVMIYDAADNYICEAALNPPLASFASLRDTSNRERISQYE